MHVEVEIIPSTAVSQLIPNYDNRAKIFSLTSQPHGTWPYGLNLSALVLLDADQDRVLRNVDVLARFSGWKSTRIELPAPRPKQAGLRLSVAAIQQHGFMETPPKLWKDSAKTWYLSRLIHP